MESIHNVLFVPFSSIYFYQNSFSTSEPEDVSIQSMCISDGVTTLFLILLGGKKKGFTKLNKIAELLVPHSIF